MKTKRTATIVLCGLLLSFFLLCSSVQARNTLWQIENKGHSLYLLGSLHVLKKDSYPLDPFIEQVYAESDTLLFETSMEMDTPAVQQKILSYGSLPAGTTISQHLSQQTWQTLQERLAELQQPATVCQQMRPWLCALTITVLELEKQGFLSDYGLDTYFHRKALADKKKIVALESIEFQLSLFFSQSRQNQEKFLKQSLADLLVIDSLSEELEGAWKTGNSALLYSLISKSFQEYPQQYERFVLRRNKNWLPVLEKALKNNKSTLVVVGAGHLVGPGSVVDLLGRKGYQVVQR